VEINKAVITLTVEDEARLAFSTEELKALIKGTYKSNPTKEDRQALAAAFDKYPEMTQIVGNLARGVREIRIKKLGEHNHFLQESVIRTMDTIERELGYEQAPMASRLLIEQVLASWADLAVVQSRHTDLLASSHSMKEGEYWDARLTRAQTRYLRALETLARVGRLSRVVPVQVNIAAQGGQQINIASEDEAPR
jgi:hypothetical protein